MEKLKRFMKRHLLRCVLSIVTTVGFCIIIVYTESWLWIAIEIAGYLFIAYIIIAIDTATEYPDEFKNIKR